MLDSQGFLFVYISTVLIHLQLKQKAVTRQEHRLSYYTIKASSLDQHCFGRLSSYTEYPYLYDVVHLLGQHPTRTVMTSCQQFLGTLSLDQVQG